MRAVLSHGKESLLPQRVLRTYLQAAVNSDHFNGDLTDNGHPTSYGSHDLVMALSEISKLKISNQGLPQYLTYETIDKKTIRNFIMLRDTGTLQWILFSYMA